MDLTFPAHVERASRMAREFTESYVVAGKQGGVERGAGAVRLPYSQSPLLKIIGESPLAHFAVLRELGRVAAPWAETFRAAGLQFHDVARVGIEGGEAGLVGLALGDPRRRPDPATLGVTAEPRRTHSRPPTTDPDHADPATTEPRRTSLRPPTTDPDHADPVTIDGVTHVPGYLAPVDSLLIAATLSGDAEDVGVFLAMGPFGEGAVTLERAPARVLERGEPAWRLLLALKRHERLSQIALAVGAARRAHELSLAAAREATAAKDALALGQAIQFQVADDAIDLQVAETLALHSATLAEAGTLGDADLASTRFMVVEALGRIAFRAAHVAGLFASTPPPWTTFFLDLARRLGLEGGAVELDRRDAALGLLQRV